MSASDELAAIEARLREDEDEYAGGVVDKNVRDRRYLLSLVREQQDRLEKVEAVASDLAGRGERIEEQFGREGNDSAHITRAAGLGDGYREAARSIRAALQPALGDQNGDAIAAAGTKRPPVHHREAGEPDDPTQVLAG